MNTNISCRSPFELFGSDFEPLFDALRGRAPAARNSEAFMPPVNIWEEEDHYVVETELAGVSPKDVEITLEGRELRIRGERKSEHSEKSKRLHLQERVYGQFQRMVRFPTEVNHEGVEAKSQDGVLRVTVKKSEALKPKRIQVS